MQYIQHPHCNAVLGAPKGVSIEECRALPVQRGELDGSPVVASFWKPSKEELRLINEGKAVVLIVQGVTHPPVQISVEA